MKNLELRVNNIVARHSLNITVRNRVLAYAVALLCAYRQPLPAMRVKSIASHYALSVKQVIEAELACVNEVMLFDFIAATGLANKLYTLRYSAAHGEPLRSILNVEAYDFFCGMFGVAMHFSPEEYTFLTENRVAIHSIARELELALVDANLIAKLDQGV